jgi:hypothetical protein
MKSIAIPRRLPTSPALLGHPAAGGPPDAAPAVFGAFGALVLPPALSQPLSRQDIERALDAGTQRHFPPRGEAEVMEPREHH